MDYRQKLAFSFEHLSDQLKQYFNLYQGINEKYLSETPLTGKWSILQNLQHLLRSEQLGLQYLQFKFIGDQAIPAVNLRNRFSLIILYVAFNSPFKFKAPEGKGLDIPENTGNITSLYNDFVETREALFDLISKIPDEKLAKAWFKHPYAGRMSLNDMLWFLSFHFKRHHLQILKVLAKTKKV